MLYSSMRAAACSLALVSVAACTGHRAPAPMPPSPAGFGPVPATEAVAISAIAPSETQPSRQIIRRGQIEARVASLDAASQQLARATSALGAQLTRSTVEERERATFLIRVPPDRLDALMDSVAAFGDVENRSVGVEDITEQVIDAEARLGALRATRDRLRQLLERAGNVQDVIAVERELARVQAEIESLEARLTVMRGQVALSELAVTLRQRPVLGPLGVVAAGLGTVVAKLFVWR